MKNSDSHSANAHILNEFNPYLDVPGWVYAASDPADENSPRYMLGEPSGPNPLVCFGINPSTATPGDLDPTLKRVKERAKREGYDGWLMFNVYPQRSTNPKGIHQNLHQNIHQENLKIIREVLGNSDYTIWASWGGNIERRPYLIECLAEIGEVVGPDNQWKKIGETNRGHPRHPIATSYKQNLTSFDIGEYLTDKRN